MITPAIDPLPCAFGYTIDAYCRYENPNHERHKDRPAGSKTFFGYSERQARSEASKAGWLIGKDWFATCPLCQKALKEQK